MVKLMYAIIGVIFSLLYRFVYFFNVNFNPLKCKLPFYFYLKNGVVRLGDSFTCRRGCTINVVGGHLSIGDLVFFNQGVSINCQSKITLGNGCIFGEGVKIYDHDHEIIPGKGAHRSAFNSLPVTIGNNVWLGAGVIILKGVTIGDNVVIAAGSVITKSIEDNSIFYQKRTNTIKANF